LSRRSDPAQPSPSRPDDPARPRDPGHEAQPALAELAERLGPDRPDAEGFDAERHGPDPARVLPEPDPARAAALSIRERRHRYLLEQSDPDSPLGPAPAEPADPAASRPTAETGNTEPLAIRSRTAATSADPHPFDRLDLDPAAVRRESGPGRPAPASAPGGTSTPASPQPVVPAAAGGAPASGDLGLRPESVARLSESGRELLARLQAELRGGGPGFSPRTGGSGANGGNGPSRPAQDQPPDLAG
jgi:hypothetical protein